MLKKSATTQIFHISYSSLLVYGLIAIHFLAFIAAGLNSLALLYKLALWVLIITSLIIYLRCSNKEFFIRYGSLSGWEIADSENSYLPITILASTVICPYLIVLHFYRQNKKKQTILIAIDALKNDEYRKLMVALKVSAMKG